MDDTEDAPLVIAVIDCEDPEAPPQIIEVPRPPAEEPDAPAP